MPLPYSYSQLSQFDVDPDEEDLGNLEDNLHLLVEDSTSTSEEEDGGGGDVAEDGKKKRRGRRKKKGKKRNGGDGGAGTKREAEDIEAEASLEGDDDVFASADAVSVSGAGRRSGELSMAYSRAAPRL